MYALFVLTFFIFTVGKTNDVPNHDVLVLYLLTNLNESLESGEEDYLYLSRGRFLRGPVDVVGQKVLAHSD